MASKITKKPDKPNDKLKSLIFEMKVEGLLNNSEVQNNKKILRVCGVVTRSNFLDEGYRFCAPLHWVPIRRRVCIDDRIRITLFCPAEKMKLKEDGEKITFTTVGCKYELWDDASEGWSCVYEKFHDETESV
jgi:hypothetical protein